MDPIEAKMKQWLSSAIYTVTILAGGVAFLYPFWLPTLQQSNLVGNGAAHNDDAPLMLAVLVGLCFAVLLLEVQSQAISTKTAALLGMLVAINAALRFVENVIPGPGGFSPIFMLIVLTGYVYGGHFGFLMGALTMLVSALVTGGIGPWLPYQMFTSGWVGMSAPICRPTVQFLQRAYHILQVILQRCSIKLDFVTDAQIELLIVACFGGLWGLLYGLIMNIWFWPFAAGDPVQYWQPGMGLAATVQRYAVFYMTTSLVWDSFRLAGNMMLILMVGAPVLRGLRRFHSRFDFSYQANVEDVRVWDQNSPSYQPKQSGQQL